MFSLTGPEGPVLSFFVFILNSSNFCECGPFCRIHNTLVVHVCSFCCCQAFMGIKSNLIPSVQANVTVVTDSFQVGFA